MALRPRPAARPANPRSSGRVNLDDIARHAGVSPITVSRALRAPDKVAGATRARIDAAIEVLGYVPDRIASSLASRRSEVVALVVPTITQALFADSIQGLSDTLRDRGYQLFVGASGYSASVETALIRALLGRRPDALVMVGTARTAATRDLLGQADIPVVEIWELPEDPIDSVVGFSNADAVRAMTAYLLASGRRRPAFLSNRDNPRARARLDGFRAALLAAGIAPESVAIACPHQPDQGLDTVTEFTKLMQAVPETDAIVCTDDLIAMDLLFHCQRRGIAVPERLAVTGFCDLPLARRTCPSLTTVRVPAYEIGREAARLVLDRLEGRLTDPLRLDLGFEIVRRESA